MNATRGRAAFARASTASLIGEPPYRIRSSEPKSRKRTAGWSAIIWIMVGTSVVSVTFCCSIASNTASGVNALMTTLVPPLRNREYIPAPFAIWNMGAACRLAGLGGGEQHRTGGVVLVPKARVGQCGPCDGFTLVEAGEGRVYQILRRHHGVLVQG